MDPDPAIFVIDLQDANKKQINKNYKKLLPYFFKVHLRHFKKIKSQKSHKIVGARFFSLFLHDDRRIQIHTSD